MLARPFERSAVLVVAAVAALVVANTAGVEAKRNDDRLVMTNGDQMVGEIQGLSQGQLAFKADYMLNTIQVDWAQVRELRSQDDYQVSLTNGTRLLGPIARAADGTFVVTEASGAVSLKWYEVVAMQPRETSFWAQLKGNLDSGFSYTHGSVSQTQFSASGSVNYAMERYTFAANGSSTFSAQSDSPGTRRNTATIQNQLTLRPKWYAASLLEFLNSEQQQLDLRTTAGGIVGRWLYLSTKGEFAAFGGAVYTHEQYSAPPDPSQPGSQVTNNFEAVLGLSSALYRFKTMDIHSRLVVYPSISSFGRVRLSYAPTINLEVIHNLYWSFTLYENYDSHPPVNANKNDFGVTNALGWRF